MTSVFDIRDYGASCEGGVVNTKAIQDAIDACNQTGGGTVYCPPGVFVTGTIWLKSFVTLHLEAGCTLLASPNQADYQENLPFPESVAFTRERTCDAHLLVEFFGLKARDLMTENPTVVRADDKAAHALELMENRPFQISLLPVVDARGRAVGILRVHDLLKASK